MHTYTYVCIEPYLQKWEKTCINMCISDVDTAYLQGWMGCFKNLLKQNYLLKKNGTVPQN